MPASSAAKTIRNKRQINLEKRGLHFGRDKRNKVITDRFMQRMAVKIASLIIHWAATISGQYQAISFRLVSGLNGDLTTKVAVCF